MLMKVKPIVDELDCVHYDGNQQSYIELTDAVKKWCKQSVLTAWERNKPIYILSLLMDTKRRVEVGDYVVFNDELNFGSVFNIRSISEDEFEENYEVVS